MNWLNLLIFMLLYAASCIPMFLAGRTDDLAVKNGHLIVDGILSIAAYVYLWFAFPSTLYSLTALITFMIMERYASSACRARGYDPYAELRP